MRITMLVIGAWLANAALADDSYFPLVEGSTWTYTVNTVSGDKKSSDEETMTAGAPVDLAGSKFVLVGNTDYFTKKDGIYAVGTRSDKEIVPLKEIVKVMPLSPKVGDKWQYKQADWINTCTVLGQEKLKTPAGEFDTVKIYRVGVGGADGNDRVEETRWAAAGVGIVKTSMTTRRIKEGAVFSEEVVRELKSYKIGSDVTAAANNTPAGNATVESLFAEGEALARKREHRAAIAKYDAAIALDPKAPRPHAFKALSLMALKDLDAAGKEIDAALALNPKEFTYHEMAGQLKILQGSIEEGKSLYDKAAALSPDNAGAVYMDLAAALSLRNDPKLNADIEKSLKKAADANPPSPDALFTLGQSYVNAGRSEGKTYLQRYIEAATKLPEEKRDEKKIRLARQLIRAIEAIKG